MAEYDRGQSFLDQLATDAITPADTLRGEIELAPITLDELRHAQLTPRVILDSLLYADVRTRISAGGTGKTTVALFEAVTLALGRELWGRMPDRQIRTLIVTREDGREILVARLREITYSMQLSAGELEQVLENVQILDLSSVPFRLSRVVEDVVYPHSENLDRITQMLEAWGPDWIIFDPLVSFGVGESRVNDAEQGLIEAFRILRNRLNCCVEGIHHSGKANAREKSLDQYAGRGGSALSDGCRMVAVMQPLTPAEWHAATGTKLDAGESGIVMALPKLSYSKPQEPIFIRRTGYRFQKEAVMKRSPEQRADAITEQVMQFIRHEFEQGRKYATADLENSTARMNLSRAQIRSAITALKVSGRVVYHEVKGKAGSHYEPVTLAGDTGDTQPEICDMEEDDAMTLAA
ncbi:AAA family ATPase [Thauera sp. WH-1]|uniref:AAA family ATPase n=1 Tax=Thauera sp. WH-1 TaxID=3398230 RepID=UPI0039FC48FB